MLYIMQNTQIFHAVVRMNTVAVINLLVALKRFDKRVRHKPMHQKRLAGLSS